MKKIIYAFLMSVILLVACSDDNDKEMRSPVEGKKVAYVINMAHSGIFDLCAERCVEVAEKLGMKCDTFFSNGNDEVFKNRIRKYAEEGYDGLFISHGGNSYSYAFLKNLMKEYPKLKIVTFDTMLEENGKEMKLKGVTQFFQDDAELATKLLDYACTTLAPDKRPVRVLKVWKGPDYLASFDRREVGYKQLEKAGRIETVETVWPDNTSMGELMTATLDKYGADDIDVIWVAYDLYAQGAFPALKASGKQIPLVSVDICETDREFMEEPNSLWKACACTDFGQNGEQGIRILALQLNHEYNAITAPNNMTPTDFIEMPASLITQENVLNNITPDTYGDRSYYVTSEWLRTCIGY